MGLVRMGPPRELVQSFQATYGLGHFIETGTYEGYTARWAASCFGRVTTVECSESLHRRAKSKWRNIPNIDFVRGDSRRVLASLVPGLREPALFWLDAHWSGGETWGEEDPCPLLEELRIIASSALSHFVLIDDARLFVSPPPPPHRPEQWPRLGEIVAVIRAMRHRYETWIIDDVIVIVPACAGALVMQYCKAANLVSQECESLSV